MVNVGYAAQLAHEANKVYCEMIWDDSQKPWGETPRDIQKSAEAGVRFVIENPGATPEDQHNAWMEGKIADGWVHGDVKDPEADPPTHPCLVPYEDLPEEQKVKDIIFRAVVLGFANSILAQRIQ